MNILLVPMSDWVSHPLPSRLHFVFEKLARYHQVHVLSFRIGRFSERYQRSTAAQLHAATLVSATDLSAYYVVNAPYHYKRIKEIISRNKIDVLVTANILASSVACVAARQRGIPVVYDYLDHFPDSAALYYRNFATRTIVRYLVEVLVKKNLRYADKTIVPSQSLMNLMRVHYKVIDSRLSLIPNGVDIDTFRPRSRNDALEKIGRRDLQGFLLIVFAGTIESRFDLETPIRAVARLAATGTEVKFLIVGPELSKYCFYLRNKYSKLSGIEFVGYVASELLPLYINAAHICIAPYRLMQMNFSITLKLLEYLASGKIAFITDIPDAKEVFGNSVIIYRDENELIRRIGDVQRNFNAYSSVTEKSRELAAQFSWNKIATSYESVLRNLVDSYS